MEKLGAAGSPKQPSVNTHDTILYTCTWVQSVSTGFSKTFIVGELYV